MKSQFAAVNCALLAIALWFCAFVARSAAQELPSPAPKQWERMETTALDSPSTPLPVDVGNAPIVQELRPLADPMQFSLAEDFHAWPRQFGSDVRQTFRFQPLFRIGMGAALAGVSANNWDAKVRRDTAVHENRWGAADNILDVVGHPATQLAFAGMVYAQSLIVDDGVTHDFSQSLFNALVITDIGTTGLKYAFGTTRPNGEKNGFPSGHTASSFALAAVVSDRYGGWLSLGAYATASMVAWQRIDDRKHDLSDVLFGAFFGYAIGKAVSANHCLRDSRIQLHAYSDVENRSFGLMAQRDF